MGGQETKWKAFFMAVDPSQHHVSVLGRDISFFAFFFIIYKTQEIN